MDTHAEISSIETASREAEGLGLRRVAAEFLHKRGLGTPALFLLELHRPFVNLGYQGSFLLEPMLSIVPGFSFRKWADAILSSEEKFAQFLEEIENCKKGEQA